MSSIMILGWLFIAIISPSSSQTVTDISSPGREKEVDYFVKFWGSFLNATVLHYVFVRHAIDCGFECQQRQGCASYNIERQASKIHLSCVLLKARKGDVGTELLAGNDTFDHYSKMSCMADDGIMTTDNCNIGKTCGHIKTEYPSSPSGHYVIDPSGEDGEPPFPVFCNMTSQLGSGVTVVGHDSEDRLLVDGNYNSPGSYKRDVTYNHVTVTQLKELTAMSSRCEQFIQYECKGSALFHSAEWYNWWVSRDGEKMTSWGGAPLRSNKCACGVTGTCDNAANSCNCELNDNVWREDSGFLTDKETLPVIQLRAGDVDSSIEKGYYTLGKLMCY
ncbi:neurexin-4 [Nematostella vectensis]|nr:neurexin-4 [Nematostella vectensis]